MKKIIAIIRLKFDSNKPINELNFKLPEESEILSVTTKNDESTIVITFMAKSEIFNSNLWREYEFVVCKCNYTEFNFDSQEKYVGTINFENNLFAIFYKAGVIVE